MFEDELSSGSTGDQLLSGTIKDAREKIYRAIVKYAYISQEVIDTNKRLQDLNFQLADARREIDRLQEAHVDLIVNKIHSD